METETLCERLIMAPPAGLNLAAGADDFYSKNLSQLKHLLVGDNLASDMRRGPIYATAFNLGMALSTGHPLAKDLTAEERRAVIGAYAILLDRQNKLLTNSNSIYAKLYARLGPDI